MFYFAREVIGNGEQFWLPKLVQLDQFLWRTNFFLTFSQ